MANIKFSQFDGTANATPVGAFVPTRANTYIVGYDLSGGNDNIRLLTTDLETSLLNWPEYQIALDGTNPEIEFTQPTGYSYGGASGTVLFTGSGATTVTRASATEINISSTDTTSLPVKDAAGATQFTSDATTGVRFTGAGATTVSFTAGTQLVTIDSTDTNYTYTLSTAQNVSDADINLTAGGGGVSSAIKLVAGTKISIGVSGNNITLDSTDTTYSIGAPNANTIRLTGSDASTDDVSVSAGGGITLSQGAADNITITNSGSFTTQSTTGTISISGSPTSTGGTLNVDQASGIVTPGTYNTANVTVDTYGRVTNIATGNIGVSQIIAGTNVTISPAGGTGAVTVNASGGGGTVNGSMLKTNIYYNDSTNPANWASYSLPSSTTMGQVQFTPTTSGIVQNVGISFVRLAEYDAYRIQLTMSVQNQADPDTIHMGLHYDALAVTGANCWYGWQNPGILDSDASLRNVAITCYWDIEARDLIELDGEEPVEVPIGGTATLYLKGAASGTGTEIQFASDGTRGIDGGWNNGNGIPSNTTVSGMPLIMTVYGISTSIRATNPGLIP